jgi:hypothetical protein
MTLGELPSTGLSIDIALGVFVFVLLIFEITIQQRTKKKIEKLEKIVVEIRENQSEVFASLENRANAIKEMLIEKTNPLTSKFNELSRKANQMLERNEALRQEFQQQVSALKAAGDETSAKFTSSHDAVRRAVQEGKSEIERMVKEVDVFAVEIEKIKDFVRERTIDLEL